MGWRGSLAIFLAVSAMIFLTHHVAIPAFTGWSNQPYLVGYMAGWIGNMLVFVVVLAVLERGHATSWEDFASRYRLGRLSRSDMVWTFAVILVAAGLYAGLSSTARWLATIPVFAPHPAWPADLGPDGPANLVPGVLFGMPLQGHWWIVPVYFAGWVINILGEELFYRGWLLPRQEVAFGRWAFAVNGTMFAFQHWMQPWNFLAIWPGALFMAWVVQRRQNTWIGIVQHGLMNLGLLVFILHGVT